MAIKAPQDGPDKPIQVELKPLSGWKRAMNHYGRKLRTALGIAALSGTAAVGAGILGQGYERGVTGYDPAAAEKERVEYTKRQRASVEDRRGTIEKGLDWIKQVGSVRSTEDLAKLSDTYAAMHQQYNAHR